MTTSVLADEVRRHMGLPRMDPREVLTRQAAQYGLELEFTPDWAGRPCLPADQAAELVRAVEQATAVAARQQRRAEHGRQAAAAIEDQRLHQRARQVIEHVAGATGDVYAGEALAYATARASVTDEQVATAAAAVLGAWAHGYRSFAPQPQPGHQRLNGAMDYADLEAAQELQQPINRHTLKGQLSPRASRRFREIIRGERP
jgi:hypothetical protein